MNRELIIQYEIKQNYSKLLKKETNETLVLKIINSSKVIFKDSYIHIEDQSNGESDYMGIRSKEKIDLKLLFEQQVCYAISKMPSNPETWLKQISELYGEFYDFYAGNSKLKDLTETIMYQEVEKRLRDISEGENCILFCPFFITLDFEKSLTGPLVSQELDEVVKLLAKREPNLVSGKIVYLIYPNFENKIVIRKIFDGATHLYGVIEYLELNYISKDYLEIHNIT